MFTCGAESIQSCAYSERTEVGGSVRGLTPGRERPSFQPRPIIDKVWNVGISHLDVPPYLTKGPLYLSDWGFAPPATPLVTSVGWRGGKETKHLEVCCTRHYRQGLTPTPTKVPAKSRLDGTRHVWHTRKLTNQILKWINWWEVK